MNEDFLKVELHHLQKEIDKLLRLEYSMSRDQIRDIYAKMDMIIRRIYPNYQEVRDSLIGTGIFHWDDDTFPNKELKQKWYIDDLKKILRGIDVIFSEKTIFGFEDFRPEKDKKETEWKLGLSPKNIFIRGKKSN